MEAIGNLNWLAIAAAGVVSMVVGALWYGPLFGKRWMALTGKSEPDLTSPEAKAQMGRTYAGMFVAALVGAFVLALFVKWAFATSPLDGAVVGVLAALGFAGPTSLSGVLFEDRKPGLFYLSLGYFAVTFALQGALLAAWP